jgi:hypothetical protein
MENPALSSTKDISLQKRAAEESGANKLGRFTANALSFCFVLYLRTINPFFLLLLIPLFIHVFIKHGGFQPPE